MSTIIEILTAAALILSIIIPGGAFLLGERNKKRYGFSNLPEDKCGRQNGYG